MQIYAQWVTDGLLSKICKPANSISKKFNEYDRKIISDSLDTYWEDLQQVEKQ